MVSGRPSSLVTEELILSVARNTPCSQCAPEVLELSLVKEGYPPPIQSDAPPRAANDRSLWWHKGLALVVFIHVFSEGSVWLQRAPPHLSALPSQSGGITEPSVSSFFFCPFLLPPLPQSSSSSQPFLMNVLHANLSLLSFVCFLGKRVAWRKQWMTPGQRQGPELPC